MIYNSPDRFHEFIHAYPMQKIRRGLIFAALMGFNLTDALRVVTMDTETQRIIDAIANGTISGDMRLYTYGYRTPFSDRLLGVSMARKFLVTPAPFRKERCRVLSSSTNSAALMADGSAKCDSTFIHMGREMHIPTIYMDDFSDIVIMH